MTDRYRVRFTKEECKPRCTWLPSETEGIDGECAYIRKGPRNTLYKRPCGTHPKDVQRLETMIKVVKKLGFGPDSSKYAQVLVDKTSLKNTLDNLKTFDRNLLNGKDALDKDVINQNVNNILSTIIHQISPKDKKELQNNPALQANLVVFMAAHNTPKVIIQEVAHLAKKTPVLDAMSDKLKAKLTSQKPSLKAELQPSKIQLENLLTVNNVAIEALTQETENLSNKLVDHTIVIETLQAELQAQQASHQTQLSTLVAEVPSKSSEILLAAQHSEELEKLRKISDASIKTLVETHTKESEEFNLKFNALTTKISESEIKNAAIQAELQVQKDSHQAQLSTLMSKKSCSDKEVQLVAQHSEELVELDKISKNTIDSLSATHTIKTTLLQKEVQDLTTKLVESQDELQARKASHQNQLSTKESQHNKVLVELDEKVREVQDLKNNFNTKISESEIKNAAIQAELQVQKAEIESQNNILSETNQQITIQLSNEKSTHAAQLAGLQNKLDISDVDFVIIDRQLTEAKDFYKSCVSDLNNLNNDNKQLREQLITGTKEYEKCQADISKLKPCAANLSEANQQITDLRKELEKIQESMSTHRKILTETKQFKKELGLDATPEDLQQLQDISNLSTKTLKGLEQKKREIKASGYIR